MISKEIVVNIPTADDSRPVATLVQIACKYDSEIKLTCGGNKVINAKSIVGMMFISSTLNTGDKIAVSCEGKDEEAAMNEIEKFLTNN